MSDCSHRNPDHDSLSQLAKDDPVAFEALRQELIGEQK